MTNALKTLIFGKQVSLVLIDTTELAEKGIQLHNLKGASAYAYAKAISVMAFMSACLKEERGEISVDIRSDGALGGFCASGNKSLFIRGYAENTEADGGWDDESERKILGAGSLTVIRDDGYARPFVGTCAFDEGAGIDGAFETYYQISEQLPTRIKTVVKLGENGQMRSGIAVMQLLPFTGEETQAKVRAFDLEGLINDLFEKGIKESVTALDCADEQALYVQYRCNCSRDYLSGVLVSLGEAQMREIIKQDGALRVHCHYCNTDYVFTDEDADKLFPRAK